MAVSVRVAKAHVSKEHADWRGVGWVATEKEGGRAFLVHRADHDAEKVKASLGVLVEDSDKVKTKDLLLLNRLDASFVDKASRVAVSSDGLYVAIVGVRKKTGGFLAVCGVGGPRKPLVHQEQGGSHPVPAVLGSNKQERPRGVFVSQGGTTVVVVAHDFSILVWRAQVAGRDAWAGVWSRVRQGSEASVVPAAFDAAFVAASEHCFTSARLWPANVSGAPLQGYTEIAETGGGEDCLQGTRHARVRARQVGAATRRMCLVVSHTTFSTAQASRAKAGQAGTVRGRTVEYATAVPEDNGTHTSRDIPCLRWDPEGALLAVVLCLQQARLCFLVPGQAASHVVELPSEMSTCCDIAWIANGMAVACTDRRGSVAIVSRLGNVLSVYSNGACAFVALGLADGPGTVSSKPSPLETIVSVGNGATFHSIVVEAAYAQVRDTVRDGVLPRWIGDAPTAIRLLGSMKGLLEETTTAPLCSALTMCLTQKSEASHGAVKVAAKELVRVYRRCVVGLEWVAGVLGAGSLVMVAGITHHLAMLLLHHLCDRLLTRSTPPREASLLLDAAFHAIKWTEGKLEDLTTQGFAGVTVHAGLQMPSWRYPEHWAMLGSKAQEVLDSADDATRQPVAVLREVVLTRLRQCFVGRSRAADLAGLASLHRGHAAFLSDSVDGGAEHYAAAGRSDCLFAARLLSGASGAVADAVELAVATLADATTWWGDTGLRHAPELLRRASSVDPSGRRPALCHALAGLTAGALYKARPRALPPVFADMENLKLVATEKSVQESGQRHMYRVLPERVVAACATKLRALTRTEEQNSLAGLNAELWLAYGWPLEALHAAMRAGLTETADRAMNLLNWQVNAQKNWDQWLDKAEPRPCSASPSTATTEADQLATYDRCRRSVEATMMSDDESAKAFMEAASRASAARGGWVCQSCVSSLMAYFMLHALKQAVPVKAQHMLSMGVATDGLRQIAAAQLTAVARSLVAQLPPFDHTVSGVSEMPAPTAIMHQVFASDGNVSDDLSRLMGTWSPQPPDSFFKQHDAISLVRNASKLLSWALICLCPSDTPSKCGASVLALLKTYRDHVMDDAPPAAPELDQFRKVLRYAWLLTVWHTVHARQQSRRALLSVPPAWSAAQEEPREATLSGHGAEWVCKLTGWSQDVWETDAVQGGVLSALELCDDPVYVAAALGKSFYEESNRDSILTIAQSKRQQYYRLTRELSPEARQQLVKDQKAFFEQTLMHDVTKEASRMVSADPYVAQLEGPGFNENANWLHELDQAFWSFANNLLDLDVMVGEEPRAKAAPRAGWAELVLLGRMLSSSTDGTLVLPYGKEESGERIPIKAAPNTGARADVARSAERAKKGPPVRGAPLQSGSTPGGGRQAKEERQEGGRAAAAAETVSVRKSTAGGHLPAVSSARISRPKQVDTTLPYELQPISHGGLLLDAELTPSSSSLPSPVHPGNLRSILHPSKDTAPSPPPPVPVPLAASRPWAGDVASTPVNAALFRASAAAARDVPPSTTCTTKSTSAGTTYTHDSTSITSTQAPSTQTTTSVPEPVDVARVLSSPARARKEKKERRREEKERRGDGRGKDRSGATKTRTGAAAAAAAGDGHDNRGVGQVHYHYGESYRGAGNAAAAGGAGGGSRRHGEGGADDAGAHGKRKPHVCSKHRARKDNPTRQRPRSTRPNRDLLLATNVAPLATDVVGAAMHRAHSAAATARAPYGPQVGLLRPQAAGPPPPPPPPEPVLLRPTTSPALAPKVSAPISNYFSLPRPRSDAALTSAAAAMPAPPTPAEASLFVASQRGRTEASPRSPPTQALDVCSVASIGLSPVQLPSPSPAKSATPHATPQRTPLGASPLASPGEVPPLPLPPVTSPAASLLDAATSPHVRATPPGTPIIVGREPVPSAIVEVPVEPARAGLPRTAPNPEQPTLVGQPVLSATEELLYAKYIRQLGITSADAVITGGIPLVSYTPAVGYVPSDNLRELNDRHEALQSVDAKYASAASPVRPVQERPQAAASVPTPAPAPVPVQPAPVDVQAQARSENLEALLSSMMEKQAVAAASTGKEMAAAFSETLKVCWSCIQLFVFLRFTTEYFAAAFRGIGELVDRGEEDGAGWDDQFPAAGGGMSLTHATTHARTRTRRPLCKNSQGSVSPAPKISPALQPRQRPGSSATRSTTSGRSGNALWRSSRRSPPPRRRPWTQRSSSLLPPCTLPCRRCAPRTRPSCRSAS